MAGRRSRSEKPTRRRSFTAAEKLGYLEAYERALEAGDGVGYLRQAGLYSSSIHRWRQERNSGLLDGEPFEEFEEAGSAVEADPVELVEMRQEMARLRSRLAQVESVLDIIRGAHALLDSAPVAR